MEQNITEENETCRALLKIFKILNSSLDEKRIASDLTGIIPVYLKYDRVALLLYDQDLSSYICLASHGFSPSDESMMLSRSFNSSDIPALKRVENGDSVWIDNARESADMSRLFVDTFKIGCSVLVPVLIGNKVRGVLLGAYRDLRPASYRDISLIKGISEALGIAINNSRLYKKSTEKLMKLNNRIETTRVMSRIDKEILSALDRDTILNTATAMINRVIPSDRAAVLLREQSSYKVIAEWGIGRFKNKTFGLSEHQCDIIENVRSPMFIPDLSLEKEYSQYYHALWESGILSCIIVPLVSRGTTIGFVSIGSKSPAKLTATHLATAEEIASQITVALEHAGIFENLQQLIINTITSFASVIDAKSPWTKGHSERVTQYAIATGIEIGMDLKSLETLRLAGVLHDIGKIGTYDVVLDKPGSLTKEEFDLVKKHPVRGARMLGPIKQLEEIIPVIRHHHERIDGKGHPDGLRGRDIPLGARIIAATDAYDSMTADRPYRKAPGKDFAIGELKRCSGTQFDPEIVDAFLKIL